MSRSVSSLPHATAWLYVLVHKMHKKGSTNMASLNLKHARIPVAVLVSLALLFLTNVGTASHAAYAAAPQSTGTFTVSGKVYHLTKGVALEVPVNWADGKIRYVAAKFDDDMTSSMAGNAMPGKRGGLAIAIPLTAYCQTTGYSVIGYDIYHIILTSYTLLEYWCYDQNANPSLTRFDPPYEQDYGNLGWHLVNHAETLQFDNGTDGYSNGIFRFNGPFNIGCNSGYVNFHMVGNGNQESNGGFASEFGC